jgi:O-antigen/teichoic acid export membrane protein
MTPKVQERNARLERLAVWSTYIALFFNPLGFDFVQFWLFELTGSIWAANLALYMIAGLFFVLSWILRRMKKKPTEADKYKKETVINIHFLDENP